MQVLHRIDEDWWLARDESKGECGMVPANYFESAAETEAEAEPVAEVYQEPIEEPVEEVEEVEEENYYVPPTPPLPTLVEQESEIEKQQQEEHVNPVDEISNSQFLKQKCDALFLDSKLAKTKGQLIFENALYLCTSATIEHCYDLSELRDYNASELKLTLNSGEKVAIGLGKKDAKKFSELVKEISGYEPEKIEDKLSESQAPPLPKAPIVVGPKIPESYEATFKKSESKLPMMVGVSFEGLEGEEVSIFEGEEVYLLFDESISDSQYARIEKVNGVQGLVPRNFLMTRSEYQKKKEIEAEEAEARKQMAELSVASKEQPTKKQSTEPEKTVTAPVTVTRSNSKASSPWSALASGSSAIALPSKQQQQQSNIKLENSRLWKDKSGKFQVEAEFVSLSDGKVTILKTSGSQVSVPLEILSERDAEYACKRAGIPYKRKNSSTTGTIVKGFDWLAFFLSIGIEAGKAKEFGEKFASQSFEESMISAFSSDFLTAQGMEMTEIYKILPEAAKRKAQAMQQNAKEKHRNNNSQVVLSTGEAQVVKKKPTAPTIAAASTLVPFKKEQEVSLYEAESPKIQMFPTIEELEAQSGGGSIELGKGTSQVALPGGISVSKTSNDDNSRVLVQPIEAADFKERSREIVGSDGSSAKEYTRISTSTTVAPIETGSSAIALMQQQMQNNALMQAQAQAQVQMQMRMQAQAQAQAQMQMQMRAQAQAQAHYQQQQRMYQMQQQQQQQQQAAPSVHITIHTGDKGVNQNPMTPPMPVMNQPMMQMNNPMGGMMGGTMGGAMGGMMGGVMGGMMNPSPMNPMNPMNPMTGAMNPFDPLNPFNNGFGF